MTLLHVTYVKEREMLVYKPYYTIITRELSDKSVVYDIETYDGAIIQCADEKAMLDRASVFDARGYQCFEVTKSMYQF